jgi:hypothetical protein
VGFREDGKVLAAKIETLWASQMMHATIWKLREGTAIPHIYLHDVVPFLSRGFNPCAKDGGHATAPPNLIFNQVAAALSMDPTKVAMINDGCNGRPISEFAGIKAEQGFKRISTVSGNAGREKAIDWDHKYRLPEGPAKRQLSRDRFNLMMAWRYLPLRAASNDDARRRHGKYPARKHISGVPTACVQIVADEFSPRV